MAELDDDRDGIEPEALDEDAGDPAAPGLARVRSAPADHAADGATCGRLGGTNG